MQLIESFYQPFTSTVTRKGQITIPAHMRTMLQLHPGDKVAFLVTQGQVRIAPARGAVRQTAGYLAGTTVPLTPRAEKAAAATAMAEDAERKAA